MSVRHPANTTPSPPLYQPCPFSRKKKVNTLLVPNVIPPVHTVYRNSDVMALGLRVPPARAPGCTPTVSMRTHLLIRPPPVLLYPQTVGMVHQMYYPR